MYQSTTPVLVHFSSTAQDGAGSADVSSAQRAKHAPFFEFLIGILFRTLLLLDGCIWTISIAACSIEIDS